LERSWLQLLLASIAFYMFLLKHFHKVVILDMRGRVSMRVRAFQVMRQSNAWLLSHWQPLEGPE
jgi:hypothetical protein